MPEFDIDERVEVWESVLVTNHGDDKYMLNFGRKDGNTTQHHGVLVKENVIKQLCPSAVRAIEAAHGSTATPA
jgi:hypothetical protein